MRYALFLGCKIPSFAPQYEKSARLVFKKLGIETVDMEFNCCGYPSRDQNFEAYLLSAAHNLARAEARGLPLLTLCKCCLGSLKRAQSFLAEDQKLMAMVNQNLAEEGLEYRGSVQVRHVQSVLHQDVGVEKISEMVTHPLEGLKVATMYGCHVLRPSRITGFDNPYQPTVIDDLIKALGATSVPWEGRLKCCGAPLRERNPELSLATISKRLQEWAQSGAAVLNVDCPHTLLQVKWANQTLGADQNPLKGVVLYPQLLGLALGLGEASLALDQNSPPPDFPAQLAAPAQAAPEQEAAAQPG